MSVNSFLKTNLFNDQEKQQVELELFSNLYSSKIYSLILKFILWPSIPSDKAKFDQYDLTTEAILDFDRKMKDEGLQKNFLIILSGIHFF